MSSRDAPALCAALLQFYGNDPQAKVYPRAKAADNTDVLLWIAIGTVAALGLSALLSLALGAILGMIGRDLGELVEADLWSVAPPARAPARRA